MGSIRKAALRWPRESPADVEPFTDADIGEKEVLERPVFSLLL